MMKKCILALSLGAALLFPISLASASAAQLKVVASFSIIADFAGVVGGDRVAIMTLVGPNGDAHVYEPKPSDAVAMAAADVILVNGVHFEGFLPRLVEAGGGTAPIVGLSKGVELLPVQDEHGHAHAAEAEAEAEATPEHGAFDPHAWQSVANAKIYVTNVADAFCTADAAGCPSYQANALAYLTRLDALEGEIRTAIAAIPTDKRTIITTHDAFGYFAHEYGLTFLAPEGLSTDAEASAGDVAALIRQIREDKASAIFVESITNPGLIEQIADETGLKVGGELYSDALSEASGPAPTYLDMMRHNINTIRGAIQGS